MNVTCTGCPAKYSVPDDKVRGKKVRITCKHCGANIVVDGSALGAPQGAASLGETASNWPATARSSDATADPAPGGPAPAVPAPAPAPPAPTALSRTVLESSWLVGFSDEHQEQHSTSAVVALYADGKIDEETLVWKDGMADWLSPFDIPEISELLAQGGIARRAPAFVAPSSSADPQSVAPDPSPALPGVPSVASELDKPVAVPTALAARQSTPEIKPAVLARQSTPELKPGAAGRQSTPEIKPIAVPKAAARRAERRPDVDLFGSVANAGSEADVSLDFGAADEPVHKLTGARNESSVLFSLDALTKPDPKASQKKAQDKEQEKQAAAALFGDAAPDSLMNVGGGGLAALAAPDFTKPVASSPNPVRPSDPVEVPNAAPAKKKGGAGLIIVALVGVAAAAGLAFVVMGKKPNAAETPAPSAQAAAEAAPVPASTAAAPTESSAPAAAAAPTEGATLPASAASATALAAAASTGQKPATASAAAATSTASAPATALANKPPEKPVDKPTPTPAAAPASGADFDKAAAIAALSAAAANAATCKKPDGPTGGGKASVTFAPSGRATNSTVSGALAGTEVGGCVARIFRSAKVPPFAGDPVTVSKSFAVE